MRSPRPDWLVDAGLVFLLTALLILPLFQVEYLNNWGSIESTFIADARMIRDGLSLNGWHPYWYCGTRFDYVYPPGLRFGSAWLAELAGGSTFRGYHWFVGLMYCLGICFVYWLARVGSGVRALGWLSAGAVALLSPVFLLVSEFRYDVAGSHYPPMRLHVLMQYGEGPHISSLGMLGGFLAAAWLGLRPGNPAMLALSALLAAAVVSLNFYGATAMAILFPLLVWALWVTLRDRGVLLRAVAVALLAWGLTAFWLTPSYLRITLDNMRLVASPGNRWSAVVAMLLVIAFAALSLRLCYGKPQRAWPLFLAGSVLFLGLNVLGNKWFGFRVIGEPHRLVPELDLVLLLALLYGLWWLWQRAEHTKVAGHRVAPRMVHAAAGVCAGLMLAGGLPYLSHAWKLYPQDLEPDKRLPYQVSHWVAANMSDARLYVTGSIRFWHNAWTNLAQLAGGSEQGLLNAALVPSWWELRLGSDPQLSILWMQATGTQGVVVSSEESREVYKDFSHPGKFAGVLPVRFDNQAGDRLYEVPRRFPERARVVEYAALMALAPIDGGNPRAGLEPYVRLVEEGPEARVSMTRSSPEQIRLRVRVAPGQAVLVQESYDPAWRAYAAGQPVAVEKDPVMGFLVVRTPEGEQDIDLRFELPGENLAGRWVSGVTLALLILLVAAPRFRSRF